MNTAPGVRAVEQSDRRTSIDYDVTAQATKRFFAAVQNKLHWAIHGQTAAEVQVVDVLRVQRGNLVQDRPNHLRREVGGAEHPLLRLGQSIDPEEPRRHLRLEAGDELLRIVQLKPALQVKLEQIRIVAVGRVLPRACTTGITTRPFCALTVMR